MRKLLATTSLSLLLLVPCCTLADQPKAVVVLDPPWDHILEKDRVELMCQGPPGPKDYFTQWWFNSSALAQQTSSYVITAARIQDSGDYSCQTGLSAPSDPQQLQVHKGWLLLQALPWKVRVGDPIRLRCHSWTNRLVTKVVYYHNGTGRRYFHINEELNISAAVPADSGSYFCRGLIGRLNESSATVHILVGDLSIPSPSPSTSFPSSAPWYRIAISLAAGFLFTLNTGLCFSVWSDLRRLLRAKQTEHVLWNREPQDK
ncbi:low affinity immunoglobulin gamma Fc region receptor III-A-like isoform X2 [Suncus etruscus]|uniref:low affinity immunoglobulin gamma Fc region receptor III-A-like isoform X2 n=1 Tax=Suncus etruscus TaxID=109475 RepID=UPI002110BFC3|nr:low affinity immunoglobulin gamma Fc region receptor III-A-like isoform X2 [Suncus etruscus]